MSYYFNTTLDENNFDKALEIVTEALKTEGFGIITKIDIKDTFKQKIDVDFKKYTILGTCNPTFAHKAISKEDKIGVFLPCNVIVEEHENGEIEVSAVDPIASMISVKNENLGSLATEIQEKLKRLIASL